MRDATEPATKRLATGRRTLGIVAALVRLGFLGLGLAVFLDQSRALLSDAEFTHGERVVMGLVALASLGGGVLAAWVTGRLIAVLAEVLDAVAGAADDARRAADLIEGQVVPALLRIATAVESSQAGRDPGKPPPAPAASAPTFARTRPAKP